MYSMFRAVFAASKIMFEDFNFLLIKIERYFVNHGLLSVTMGKLRTTNWMRENLLDPFRILWCMESELDQLLDRFCYVPAQILQSSLLATICFRF
jgi:hypothetical protein